MRKWHSEIILSYSVRDGVLLYKNRFYIAADSSLKLLLLDEFHSSNSAGNDGVKCTIVHLSHLFFWPGMHKDVNELVEKCMVLQQIKFSTQAPTSLYHNPCHP